MLFTGKRAALTLVLARNVSLAGLANPTFEIGLYVILCSLYSHLNRELMRVPAAPYRKS